MLTENLVKTLLVAPKLGTAKNLFSFVSLMDGENAKVSIFL